MAEHEDLISVMMTVQRTDLRQQTIALFTTMEDRGWHIETARRFVSAVTESYESHSKIEIQTVVATLR